MFHFSLFSFFQVKRAHNRLECTAFSSEFQASPDGCPAAIHEFQIPPKALLGLHSYCPIYFDAFHAVLVDVSVHITLLKAGSRKAPMKVPRFVTDSRANLLNSHIPFISPFEPSFGVGLGGGSWWK